MSEFYRFPAIKDLEEFDNSEQLEKIDSEVEESRDAYFGAPNGVAFGIELMDVIHAAERHRDAREKAAREKAAREWTLSHRELELVASLTQRHLKEHNDTTSR